MNALYLGLDLGTSGLRSAVVDETGAVVSTARAHYPEGTGAESWWSGAMACLTNQMDALRGIGRDPKHIAAMAVDGTSGSMVLTRADLTPVTQPLMYNSAGFKAEAQIIAKHAPKTHITRGENSALARALRLVSEDEGPTAAHLLHQADFIAAKLMGRGGLSDDNNALKTGYDPQTGRWPDWISQIGLPDALLPEVRPAGALGGPIAGDVARTLGLADNTRVHMGTTDSVAAFLAAAPLQPGVAVTSLGTTLAIKVMSEARIDAPEFGLYSHKLGQGWLVGGASNTGGGVLLAHFAPDEIAQLSQDVDPLSATPLDYYPLVKPGERFPINDPNFAPRLSPRPAADAAFLHGMLEGIARIERECYAKIAELGGPEITALYTAGGGAQNPVWKQIRERVLGLKITRAEVTEAAVGTARLLLQKPDGG